MRRTTTGASTSFASPGRLRLRRMVPPASAIGPLSEASALRPTDQEVTVLLADALLAAGLVDDAASLLEAAIAQHNGKRSRDLASLQHRMAKIARADRKSSCPGSSPPSAVIRRTQRLRRISPSSRPRASSTRSLRAWRAVVSGPEASPVLRATAYASQAGLLSCRAMCPEPSSWPERRTRKPRTGRSRRPSPRPGCARLGPREPTLTWPSRVLTTTRARRQALRSMRAGPPAGRRSRRREA